LILEKSTDSIGSKGYSIFLKKRDLEAKIPVGSRKAQRIASGTVPPRELIHCIVLYEYLKLEKFFYFYEKCGDFGSQMSPSAPELGLFHQTDSTYNNELNGSLINMGRFGTFNERIEKEPFKALSLPVLLGKAVLSGCNNRMGY